MEAKQLYISLKAFRLKPNYAGHGNLSAKHAKDRKENFFFLPSRSLASLADFFLNFHAVIAGYRGYLCVLFSPLAEDCILGAPEGAG